MARPRYPKHVGPLPPALPPERRTVGQLVAESLRFYGEHFWPCLALGPALAVVSQLSLLHPKSVLWQVAALAAVGSPLLTAAYVRAVILVTGAAVDRGVVVAAWLLGVLAFLPVPVLVLGFVLPAIAWLAAVGLVVPVVLVERRRGRAAFARAFQLFQADSWHAFFGLFTVVLVFVLTRVVLTLLLHGQGNAVQRVAAFLADTVLSPILYLGATLLYADQAARVGRVKRAAEPEPGPGAPS